MSFIKIYITNNDGLYTHSRVGGIDTVMSAIDSFKESFTLTPPPDYDHVWRWVDTEWIEVPKTNEVQTSEQWQQLKNERGRKISSGVFVESTGKVFQTDNNSLTQYASIAGMIALDNYEPVQWKTLDNSFVLLTVDIFKELQRTINENTQSAFRVAEQKRIADQPS